MKWRVTMLKYLPLLFITACATAPQPIVDAFNATHKEYVYSPRKSNPASELKRPKDGTANCTLFAMAYRGQLITRGINLDRHELVNCITPQGEKHVYLLVDGKWAMDSRFPSPFPVKMSDCTPIK